MKMLKQLLLMFFAGLGIHRVVQDIWAWIDPEFEVLRGPGYFSAIAFVLLYITVKYLKQREPMQGETN
jgi:hypothetical protein